MTVTFMRDRGPPVTLTGWVEIVSSVGGAQSGSAHQPGQLVAANGVDPQLQQCRLTAQLGPDPRPERQNTWLEPSNRTA